MFISFPQKMAFYSQLYLFSYYLSCSKSTTCIKSDILEIPLSETEDILRQLSETLHHMLNILFCVEHSTAHTIFLKLSYWCLQYNIIVF